MTPIFAEVIFYSYKKMYPRYINEIRFRPILIYYGSNIKLG